MSDDGHDGLRSILRRECGTGRVWARTGRARIAIRERLDTFRRFLEMARTCKTDDDAHAIMRELDLEVDSVPVCSLCGVIEPEYTITVGEHPVCLACVDLARATEGQQ